ncbi:MAG: PEP-CTERM sorting domain-containing protein [Pirellulaceae bacterium]|nr:PEP-CTERM sorting domain-containing protein [Pirellulaceae bacterium]
MSRFLVALAGACALLAVALPGAASAEMIRIEDFEDESGQPAYDTKFEHQFSGCRPGDIPNWSLVTEWNYPHHGSVLYLALGTEHTVRFNLTDNERVVHASVDVRIIEYSPGMGDYWSVTFLGSENDKQISIYFDRNYVTVQASFDEIGFITGVKVRVGAQYVDNITAHVVNVVPEPSMLALLITMLVACSRGIFHRRRQVA